MFIISFDELDLIISLTSLFFYKTPKSFQDFPLVSHLCVCTFLCVWFIMQSFYVGISLCLIPYSYNR